MGRKMKDSGSEWIGEIPEGWGIRCIGNISKVSSSKRVFEESYTDSGIPFYRSKEIGELDKGNEVSAEIYISEKVFNECNKRSKAPKKGDLLLTSIGTIGKIWISDGRKFYFKDGNLTVIEANENNNTEFIRYCFKSAVIFEQYNLLSAGSTLLALTIKKINGLSIAYPPLGEQYKIVKYLDNKCLNIDETIEKEKQVIEKLKEYKQSVITEAVTKGLNSNEKMKDSGIEWIGEIPEHWEVYKVKHLVDFNPNYKGNLKETDNVSFAPMETVTTGTVAPKATTLDKVKNGYTFFADEDIIMAKVTPCFENGNIAIAENLINGIGFGSSELYVFRCTKINNRFMFYFLQNSLFKERCISTMYGTGGLKRVSSSYVYNYKVANPSREEQKQISFYLDKKCDAIDKAISNKETLIKKLEEYQKSLIYECVTGKREV